MRSSGPQEIQPYYFWKRWCNLFDEISQEQIDQMQEKAMQSEQ
jgi:hypothetical protein